jgi:hypothetical protein
LSSLGFILHLAFLSLLESFASDHGLWWIFLKPAICLRKQTKQKP